MEGSSHITKSVHPFAGPMASAERVKGKENIFRTDAGDFEVPIEYFNVRTFIVSFSMKLEALRGLLPSDVRPRRLYGDYGALIVQFADIPNTSIGSYNECIVSIMADSGFDWPSIEKEAIWNPPPCYAIWLSVSSKIAQKSGQAIWGYPKVIGDTSFRIDEKRFFGQVTVGDTIIISCSAALPENHDNGYIYMRSFAHREGVLCYTTISGDCQYSADEPGDCELHFYPGTVFSTRLCDMPKLTQPSSTVYLSNYTYKLDYPIIAK